MGKVYNTYRNPDKTTIVRYDLFRYKRILVVAPDEEESIQVVLDKFFSIYNI